MGRGRVDTPKKVLLAKAKSRARPARSTSEETMTQIKALSRRRVLKGAAGTALLGIVGFPAISKAQADTIKLGHLTPLTGFLGQLGVYGQNAAKMAVEEINGHGGALAPKLPLVTAGS